MIIDDRSSGTQVSTLGTAWRAISDQVMGGLSQANMGLDSVNGRPCLRLSGDVRLENAGGFIQMALELSAEDMLNASDYAGLELVVCGNSETYNAHLRTPDLSLPWQSYRQSFGVAPEWHAVRLPFSKFQPYRIRVSLDTTRLKRLGLVAVGRAFTADLCVARVALYR